MVRERGLYWQTLPPLRPSTAFAMGCTLSMQSKRQEQVGGGRRGGEKPVDECTERREEGRKEKACEKTFPLPHPPTFCPWQQLATLCVAVVAERGPSQEAARRNFLQVREEVAGGVQ